MYLNNDSKTQQLPLKGKIALVTGAGGFGIGTETAIQLAKNGAKVYLNGTNAANLEQVAGTIRKFGGVCDIRVADISNAKEVSAMFANILDIEGGMHVLVSNAARGSKNVRIDKVADEEWANDIATILSGAFYCVRASVPAMIKQRWGKIIFISSSAATRGTWGRGIPYAAAKAGLHGMTKQLALELAAYNINVNTVAPNQILTPRVLKDGRRTEASIREYAAKHVPVGRPGMPQDVAELVAFLARAESSYITGQIIHIDGGSALASSATMGLK